MNCLTTLRHRLTYVMLRSCHIVQALITSSRVGKAVHSIATVAAAKRWIKCFANTRIGSILESLEEPHG